MSADAPARPALLAGMRDSFGIPSAVLGAGYLGFGALALENDFTLALALFCTATIWALPGQIVLVELNSLGAAAAAILPAVMLTSARFLPMTMALMPAVRQPHHRQRQLYLAAHLVAMTGWAAAMRRFPEMPAPQRLPYFVGFALVNWAVCLVCTAAGFLASDLLSHLVKVGLVFLNPIYFVLILSGEVRRPLWVLALVCGAVAGPAIHLVTPAWSVLLGGVAGGTAAYAIGRIVRTRHD